jgi:hypothetical protein
MMEEQHYHSLLYGISRITSIFGMDYDYIAYAGTQLTLKNAEIIQSPLGRSLPIELFFDFPYFNANDVWKELGKILNLKDTQVDEETKEKLVGRPRLTFSVLKLIDTSIATKSEVLTSAINASFSICCDTLVKATEKKLQRDPAKQGVVATALVKILLATSICHEKNICFSAKSDYLFDFVHAGIFHVKQLGKAVNSNYNNEEEQQSVYVTKEPLGQEISKRLIESFKSHVVDASVLYYANLILETKDIDDQAKGKLLERLVARAMTMEGTMDKLANCPRIYKTDKEAEREKEDTKLIASMKFQTFGTVTALGFGPKMIASDQDMQVLEAFVKGTKNGIILLPTILGADLLGICESEGKKCLIWGQCKFHKQVIEKDMLSAKSQVKPSHAYYKCRTKQPEPFDKFNSYRSLFDESKKSIDRIFLLSVILPRPNKNHLTTKEDLQEGEVLINLSLGDMNVFTPHVGLLEETFGEIEKGEEVVIENSMDTVEDGDDEKVEEDDEDVTIGMEKQRQRPDILGEERSRKKRKINTAILVNYNELLTEKQESISASIIRQNLLAMYTFTERETVAIERIFADEQNFDEVVFVELRQADGWALFEKEAIKDLGVFAVLKIQQAAQRLWEHGSMR